MGAQDRRCSVWYDKSGKWQDEMRALRAILLDTPLDEAFKWRGPVYTHVGGNLALIFGIADGFGVSFFKGVLLDDPEGRLSMPGPNSRAARYIKLGHKDEIAEAEAAIRDFVAQSIRLQEKGVKVELDDDDFDLPKELIAAMETDEALAQAFEALTPGRRRSWVIHITGAKQSATRTARIERARDRILEGKGLHDR